MRIILACMVTVVTMGTAFGADLDKTCILKAAAALPSIPGLAITKTATRPLPDGVKAHPGFEYRYVDVDFAAAGVTDRATFLCASGEGTIGVMRVGN